MDGSIQKSVDEPLRASVYRLPDELQTKFFLWVRRRKTTKRRAIHILVQKLVEGEIHLTDSDLR